MKEVETVRTHEEETGTDGPHYASLTAGLLARKGEAVPAAAAFTAEAIAQHIPARRLAQEAKRVLNRSFGNDEEPADDKEGPGDESTPKAVFEGAAADTFDPLMAEHQEQVEKTFFDRSRPNGGQSPRQRIADAQNLLDTAASRGSWPEPIAPVEEPFDPIEEPVASLQVGDAGPALGEVPPEAIPSLEDSEENWFEEIVSKAISEAEDQRTSVVPVQPVAPEPEPGPEPSTPRLEGIVANAQIEGRSSRRCGSKAAKVRQAIRTGGPRTAAKSAMRLDPRRFIRLSLAAQKLQLNNQELMMAALDSYLDALDDEVFSECSCMKKGLI